MNMSRFNSAEEAVARFLDPAPELERLIELHDRDGKYDPANGPAGLRSITQALWVPRREDGTIIKVPDPDMDIPGRESLYGDLIRQESWSLLEALGCLDGFAPLSKQYGIVFAHGTTPLYAKPNFDWIVDLVNRGLKIRDEIFMLSAPYMIRDPEVAGLDSFNARLIPQQSWQWEPPITEIVSMAWLWQHTPKPPSLERVRVTIISSSDAKTPRGPWVIPDTLDSLDAMYECCFDPNLTVDGYDDFVVRSFPSVDAILNLVATRRQLLRQHVVTRAFLRRKGINCQIHTINAHTNEPQWLVLALREVAALVWALCDELGVPTN